MLKLLSSLVVITLLNGCALTQTTGLTETNPTLTTQMKGVKKEFDTLAPPAAGRPVSVAVYSFADKTGQRRPQANVASLSMAVTQGAEAFLIQALQGVGRGKWFDVVERVGIDNLTKERLIIRQMREAYEGPKAQPLMPMQFAGMILEGGIIGYDATTTSGGAGMRIFGIGKQTQWSTDTVTVSLRAVSVNTGKVLAVVTVQKTILSTADSMTALKFFDQGTQAFEAEAGLTINEPGTYAVKATIEMAVVELIKEGARKGVWAFKQDPAPVVERPLAPTPVPEVKKEAPVLEPKKEEPKPALQSAAGKVYLKETSFIYREKNEKSQRTWQFVAGTELTLITRENEWAQVKDAQGRGGWVLNVALQETPVEKSVPQVNKEVIKADGQGKK
jgi:curli production assembly/transport component CsgG